MIKKYIKFRHQSSLWSTLSKRQVDVSWTVKKAERRRIDAFGLWCWRRLLRVPWITRRSNQSIQEINPGISLEGMMLNLNLQYFGHLIQRVDSLEKPWCWEGLGAGGEGDNRGWDGWMASRTRWRWVWVNSGSWWWAGRPGVLQFMGSQRVGHDWVTELNWTEIRIFWDVGHRGSCCDLRWRMFFLYSLGVL